MSLRAPYADAKRVRPSDLAEHVANIQAAAPYHDRLVALAGHPTAFQLLPRPGPDDWLACNRELGQSFRQYCKVTSYTMASPHASFDTVLLVVFVPSSSSEPDDTRASMLQDPSILDPVRRYVEAFYHPLRVQVVVERLDVVTRSGRAGARSNASHRTTIIDGEFDIETGVYAVSVRELSKLALNVRTRDPGISRRTLVTMGLTMLDLRLDTGWVYGCAMPNESSGVFSLARFHPAFCGPDPTAAKSDASSTSTIVRRACKVLTHELGHLFGLKHCTDLMCLMNGANHVTELNRQPMLECPACTQKLTRCMRWDLARRYARLATVSRELAFVGEANTIDSVVLPAIADVTPAVVFTRLDLKSGPTVTSRRSGQAPPGTRRSKSSGVPRRNTSNTKPLPATTAAA